MKCLLKGALTALLAIGSATMVTAENYGLPSGIQEGNILHCFNWSAAQIKEELPNIAAAGFGSVQMSPLQRPDVKASGSPWHDLYRPYDLAFKPSGFCSEADLQSLCSAASQYGIKIIVDVVANHVDKTAGYHDTWWDSNGRIRWEGGINYGNRYSITHGQLGDYGDVNSESSEVQARAKSYVEKLKSLGVKGIRWDAAKHIALPSENCGFWTAVTSVSGMYHYGEILDNPGPDPSIIKEYARYMSVTDNQYCNYAARDNGGIPGGYGGAWVVNQGVSDTKLVYWAESHDTYSNDDWSKDRDQATIDRAYAAYASRNGATCLYLARPNTKGFNNIKTGKGSTAFKSKHITEVNKFRNAMVGKADWFESNGNACSITRQNGGAVIVMKGSGNVSIKNGGGYCPSGNYTDRVSGGSFTVTSSTISGNVGSSGIAVLWKDENGNQGGGGTQGGGNEDPGNETSSMYLLGNLKGAAGWGSTPGTGVAMTQSGNKYTAKNVEFVLTSGETKCYFNLTDYVGSTWDDLNMSANRYGSAVEGQAVTIGTPAKVVAYLNNVDASGCLSWTCAPGTYDVTFDKSAMTVLLATAGSTPDPDPETPSGDLPVNVYVDGNWTNVHAYIYNESGASVVANASWPGVAMAKDEATGYWKVAVPDNLKASCQVIINTGASGANRYPADMEPGMRLAGKSMIFHVSTTVWEEYDEPVETPEEPEDPEDPEEPGDPETPETPEEPGDYPDLWIVGYAYGITPPSNYPMTNNNGVYTINMEDLSGAFAIAGTGLNPFFTTADREMVVDTEYVCDYEGKVLMYLPSQPKNVTITFDYATKIIKVTSSAGVENVATDATSDSPVYFNLQGVRVDNPTEGIFIRVQDGQVEKIRL